jgi:hypothetical protein
MNFEFEFDLVPDCRQFMRSQGGFSVTLDRHIDSRRCAAQARARVLRLAKGQVACGRRRRPSERPILLLGLPKAGAADSDCLNLSRKILRRK